MAEPKFYRCEHCGNVLLVVNDGGVVPSCCGEPMVELKAGSTDAATEKHVPALEFDGKHVIAKVGEVAHPMLEEHFIQWIAYVSDKKTVFKYLKPGEEPVAKFCRCDDEHGAIYEYCNLHGLWKAEF